jgi:hypothetical protein
MAENKVVNTTQLDADLTTIANAIREKTGESDSLAFPNGFAEAILAIAGLPTEMSKIDAGTYTFAEDKTNAVFTITHNLGEAPDFYVFYKQGNWTGSTSVNRMLFIAAFDKAVRSGSSSYKNKMWICYRYVGTGTTATAAPFVGAGDGFIGFDATTFKVYVASGSAFASGDTFNWICGKMITQ